MADENDLDILAWTMLGEAAGEGSQGMADVGHVILNRLNNGKYGSSIADVAKANKQFSTWNSGAGGNDPTGRYPKGGSEFKRARELAAQVVAGTVPGPPGRPLDYHAPSVSPYWADSKDRFGKIERNGHVFYPSSPVPPGELPEVASALSISRTPPPIPARRPDSASGLHPYDAKINTPRQNADGTHSTEITRTVQLPNGDWTNVPSLWWGQGSSVRDMGPMGDDQLADFAMRYEKQTGNAFPRHGGMADAERFAVARSAAGGGEERPITYPAGRIIDGTFAKLNKPARNAGDGLALNPVTRGQTAPLFDGEYSELNQGMMRMPAPEATWGMNQERTPYPTLPSPQMAGLRATRPDTQVAANQTAEQMRSRSNIGQPPVTRSVPSVPVPVQTAQARLPELSAPFSGVPLPQPRPDTSRLVATIPTTQPAIPRGTSSVMDNYAFNTLPGMPRIDANAPDRLMASAGLPELFGNGGIGGIGGNAVAPMPFSRPSFLSLPSMPPMPYARPSQRTAPAPMPANMRPQSRAPIFLQPAQRRAPVPMPTPQRQRAAVVNNGNNGNGSQNSQPSVVNGHSASGGVRYDPDSGDWVRA